NFRQVPLPQGGSLFDATLMIMHTELDRMPYIEPAPGGSYSGPGTNHGFSASAILAGYGIRGGTVIGDVHPGPFLQGFGDPKAQYMQPLPIDPSTGLPKPLDQGGRVQTVKAIFPTVLGIFGAQVPMEQLTEFSAVQAVIKS